MNSASQDTHTPDNSQELNKILNSLSKITSRSPEEIKPHLEKFLVQLEHKSNIPKDHFYETASDEELITAFHQWSESHRHRNLPVLSEEAMSRESMYPDRW